MMISTLTSAGPETAIPAKIVMERRVHPGAEPGFRDWTARFVDSASRFPGHEGASVLSAHGNLYFILLRFASGADLARWHESAEYVELMKEADSVSRPGEPSQVQSGLETWFTLPDLPAPSAPPPKWKMAALTWTCLLPMVIALSYLLAPFALPYLVNVALSTAIPVSMLTWVIMPRLTRRLYGWLYPSAHAR